jgi:hypothetical protein
MPKAKSAPKAAPRPRSVPPLRKPTGEQVGQRAKSLLEASAAARQAPRPLYSPPSVKQFTLPPPPKPPMPRPPSMSVVKVMDTLMKANQQQLKRGAWLRTLQQESEFLRENPNYIAGARSAAASSAP